MLVILNLVSINFLINDFNIHSLPCFFKTKVATSRSVGNIFCLLVAISLSLSIDWLLHHGDHFANFNVCIYIKFIAFTRQHSQKEFFLLL